MTFSGDVGGLDYPALSGRKISEKYIREDRGKKRGGLIQDSTPVYNLSGYSPPPPPPKENKNLKPS
jgi:hypothetical protein